MTSKTLSLIREYQRRMDPKAKGEVLAHEPEMLLIGCVDARKDIIGDIGVPKGKALVYRNIAALVCGVRDIGGARSTEAAALEFAIKVMKVKDVVVMGHTDCGGIRAVLEGLDMPEIKRYLSPLEHLRAQARAEGGSKEHKARLMEREAVRLSLVALRTYPYIAEAEGAGKLALHGWVLDITTGRLDVFDEATGEYAPMAKK